MSGDANRIETEKPIDGYAEELRVLEAVLFAAKEPVPVKTLAEHLPPEKQEDAGDILKMLQLRYEGRGIALVCRDGAWAFRTAPDIAGKLRIEREVPKKLSRAAMETLAIIAYHQPVTRAEIENIRGVSTGRGTLDILMEIGWVKPGRRRQVPGRPLTWLTTSQFLDHFDLAGLDELPGVEEMKEAGLLDSRAAIDTLPQSDMFADRDEDEEDDNPVDAEEEENT
ncbi:MAG: SMC-Scp complex subunit ScpB [Micavibrio sp.]|nr:MAG: SMC-Scp complex subunit ScpB [Micavibrio sp.]